MLISIFVLKILTLFLFIVDKLKGINLFKIIENFAQYYSECLDYFLCDTSFHNDENFNQI